MDEEIKVKIDLPLSYFLDSEKLNKLLSDSESMEEELKEEIKNTRAEQLKQIIESSNVQNAFNTLKEKYTEDYIKNLINEDVDKVFRKKTEVIISNLVNDVFSSLASGEPLIVEKEVIKEVIKEAVVPLDSSIKEFKGLYTHGMIVSTGDVFSTSSWDNGKEVFRYWMYAVRDIKGNPVTTKLVKNPTDWTDVMEFKECVELLGYTPDSKRK